MAHERSFTQRSGKRISYPLSLGVLTTENLLVKDISIIHETPATIYITLPQTGHGQRINSIAVPKSAVASIAGVAQTHE